MLVQTQGCVITATLQAAIRRLHFGPGDGGTAGRRAYRTEIGTGCRRRRFSIKWGKCALGCEPAVLRAVRARTVWQRAAGAVNATARLVSVCLQGRWVDPEWGGDLAPVL
jgi:hypothetical protein